MVICVWSASFPFGPVSDPGPAYLPFGCGLIFIFLGSIQLFFILGEASKRRAKLNPSPPFFTDRKGLRTVALALGGMLLAAASLETLGFTATLFLLMLFLTQVIQRQKWKVAFSFALMSAIGSMLLFQVILKTDLPSGFLKF